MKPKLIQTIIRLVPTLLFIPSILKDTTTKYSFVNKIQSNYGMLKQQDSQTLISQDPNPKSDQDLNQSDNDNSGIHEEDKSKKPRKQGKKNTEMNQENDGYSKSNDQHLNQSDNDNSGIDEEIKSSSDQKNINEDQEARSKKSRKQRKKENKIKEQNYKKEILNRFIEFILFNNDQGDNKEFDDQLRPIDLRLLDVNIIEDLFHDGFLSAENLHNLIIKNIEQALLPAEYSEFRESPTNRNQEDFKSDREIAEARWKAFIGGSLGYLNFDLLTQVMDLNIITSEDINYSIEQGYIDNQTHINLQGLLKNPPGFLKLPNLRFEKTLANIKESLDNYKQNKIKENERRKSTEPKDITLHDLLNKEDEEIDESKKKTLLVNLFIDHSIADTEINRLVINNQIDQTLYNNIINNKKIKKLLYRRKLNLTQRYIDVQRIDYLTFLKITEQK